MVQVSFQIGAHGIAARCINMTLESSRRALSRRGVLAPPQPEHRNALRSRLDDIEDHGEAGDIGEFVQALAGKSKPDRLVMCNGGFLCSREWVFQKGKLYPNLEKRAARLARALEPMEPALHLAIEDMRTFIPQFSDLTLALGSGSDPFAAADGLSWADVVARLRSACPGAEIFVWVTEDMQITYERVLETLTGIKDRRGFRDVETAINVYRMNRALLSEPDEALAALGLDPGVLNERYCQDLDELQTMSDITLIEDA